MASNLARKNHIIDAVRGQIRQIVRTSSGNGGALGSLLHLLDDRTNAEIDWRLVDATLDHDADNEFIRKLSERYTGLTPEELKICSLLRANLTTKQIAALRFVSDRTVQNQRFRIREKLGLPSRANLAAFLIGL